MLCKLFSKKQVGSRSKTLEATAISNALRLRGGEREGGGGQVRPGLACYGVCPPTGHV